MCLHIMVTHERLQAVVNNPLPEMVLRKLCSCAVSFFSFSRIYYLHTKNVILLDTLKSIHRNKFVIVSQLFLFFLFFSVQRAWSL